MPVYTYSIYIYIFYLLTQNLLQFLKCLLLCSSLEVWVVFAPPLSHPAILIPMLLYSLKGNQGTSHTKTLTPSPPLDRLLSSQTPVSCTPLLLFRPHWDACRNVKWKSCKGAPVAKGEDMARPSPAAVQRHQGQLVLHFYAVRSSKPRSKSRHQQQNTRGWFQPETGMLVHSWTSLFYPFNWDVWWILLHDFPKKEKKSFRVFRV